MMRVKEKKYADTTTPEMNSGKSPKIKASQ